MCSAQLQSADTDDAAPGAAGLALAACVPISGGAGGQDGTTGKVGSAPSNVPSGSSSSSVGTSFSAGYEAANRARSFILRPTTSLIRVIKDKEGHGNWVTLEKEQHQELRKSYQLTSEPAALPLSLLHAPLMP